MPKIPRIESDAQLISPDSAPKVNPEMGGLPGQMVQAGANAVGKLAEKYTELHTLNTVSEESKKLREGLSQTQIDYSQDQDITKNSDAYLKRMEELRAKAGETIFDPEAKMKFKAQADAEVDTHRLQFSNKLVDHNMNIARSNLLNNIQTYKQQFAESGDPKWMKQAQDEISQGLNVGFISADNALRIGESLNQDFSDFAVDQDAIIDPSMAKQKIIAKKYPYMDQETATKKLAELDKKIKARDKANRFKFENLKDTTELEHATAFIQGKGNIDKFREDVGSGLIEPSAADAMNAFANSPYGDFQTLSQQDKQRLDQAQDKRVYNDLLSRSYKIQKNGNKDARLKLFNDLFNAGAEGKITPSGMEQIFGNFNTEFQHAADQKQTQDATWSAIQGAALDSARFAFQYTADPEQMAMDFAQKMLGIPRNASPKEIRDHASETIKLMLRSAQPEIFNLDDVPQNLYSALGFVKKIWNGEADASADKRKTK